MNYQETHKILEHRRLLKLAHEYRQKGYSVDIYPPSGKLPPTLANLSLDLIAVKGSEVIAAKVRTRETLSLDGSDDLRRISESVDKLPGWVFELVVTNSRK